MEKNHKLRFITAIGVLCVLDAFVWISLFSGAGNYRGDSVYFLDVGQGDAEILNSRGARILIDAGPDAKIVSALEKIFPAGDKRIDMVIFTHPQMDHFYGLKFLLDNNFDIGAVIINGRDDGPDVRQWPELISRLRNLKIPIVTLRGGDSIRFGSAALSFLAPRAGDLESAELNDTGFVIKAKFRDFSALFAADIDSREEYGLLGADLKADILKVGHHGSKYSSAGYFLEKVSPAVAVIEVGAKNTYGHPAQVTLERLKSVPYIFRTDLNGTVSVTGSSGKLRVFKEK